MFATAGIATKTRRIKPKSAKALVDSTMARLLQSLREEVPMAPAMTPIVAPTVKKSSSGGTTRVRNRRNKGSRKMTATMPVTHMRTLSRDSGTALAEAKADSLHSQALVTRSCRLYKFDTERSAHEACSLSRRGGVRHRSEALGWMNGSQKLKPALA